MRFVKMHGLGNDFVCVVDGAERIATPEELARRVSDRHRGVGADGLILVLAPDPGVDADVLMRIFNADGSEPEMCGNGVRLVCKLAHDRGVSRQNPMRIQTGRGVLPVRYELDARGRVTSATVGMGAPILEAARVPVSLAGLDRVVDAAIDLAAIFAGPADGGTWFGASGLDPRLTCVSMGNPHAVLFCRNVGAVPLKTAGPALERHGMFPNRTNVHFAEVLGPADVRVRTWERGAGATLACGTGACAVCVAGALTGRSARKIRVRLPGGDLGIEWSGAGDQVWMTGPAVEVFSGEWPD